MTARGFEALRVQILRKLRMTSDRCRPRMETERKGRKERSCVDAAEQKRALRRNEEGLVLLFDVQMGRARFLLDQRRNTMPTRKTVGEWGMNR